MTSLSDLITETNDPRARARFVNREMKKKTKEFVLKRRGYKIGRDFFKWGCVARYKGRSYRFRWWYTGGEFFVDISCPRSEFDRWANSTEDVVNFYNWLEGWE